MDFLWGINLYSFNGWVSISDGCLDYSIVRMGIIELETYAHKWWNLTSRCFVLGFMARDQANVGSQILDSKGVHRTVGYTVPTL